MSLTEHSPFLPQCKMSPFESLVYHKYPKLKHAAMRYEWIARSVWNIDIENLDLETKPSSILLRMDYELASKVRLSGVNWKKADSFVISNFKGQFCANHIGIKNANKKLEYKHAKEAQTNISIFRHILKDITLDEMFEHVWYEIGDIHFLEWVTQGVCFMIGYQKPVRVLLVIREDDVSYGVEFHTEILFVDYEDPMIVLADTSFTLKTDPLHIYNRGSQVTIASNDLHEVVDLLLRPIQKKAVRKIEDAFLRAKFDPTYKMCRDMLLKDMKEITKGY